MYPKTRLLLLHPFLDMMGTSTIVRFAVILETLFVATAARECITISASHSTQNRESRSITMTIPGTVRNVPVSPARRPPRLALAREKKRATDVLRLSAVPIVRKTFRIEGWPPAPDVEPMCTRPLVLAMDVNHPLSKRRCIVSIA